MKEDKVAHSGDATTTTAPVPPAQAEAEHWKARYEEERERLVKLWVAYQALEAGTAMVTSTTDGQPTA